jgi:pimeloyl-ACP methyl ester carboxylesterase
MLRAWRSFCSGIALLVAPALAMALVMALAPHRAQAAKPTSTGYMVHLHPDGMPPLEIYAEEMGKGPTVLLLHGLGGSSYNWRLIAPRLATTHRVIALDLRGFGRSDKPFDRAYSSLDHAAVVRAFIRRANLSQVTLVGHSYGGMVAIRLAMDRRLEPHRISRLVLMSTPAFPQPFSTGVGFLRKPILPYLTLLLVPPELTATLAFMMETVGINRLTERDISIYAGPLSDPGGPHALIETARQIVPADLPQIMARYPTLTKPTLALWCRQDEVVPLSTGVKLARTLPNARLAVVEGCNHLPAEQAPVAVTNEIRRFLAR